MRTVIVVLAIAAIAATVVTATATATVPQTVNYQGVLKDNFRKPVPGMHSMTFRLYNDSSGGSQVWEETQTVSVDSAGLFNVILGSVTSVPDSAFRAQAWLGTSVGADPEMTPRVRLSSVGYAYRVNSVDGAMGGTVYGDLSLTQGSKLQFLSPGSEPYFKDVNGVRYTSDLLHPFQIENAGLMVGYTSSGGGIGSGDLLVSGNVGIGTTNPGAKLDVAGTSRFGGQLAIATSDGIELLGDPGNVLNVGSPQGIALQVSGSGSISLMTNNLDRLNVREDGRVDIPGTLGIGTTSPLYKLHVEGPSYSHSHSTAGVGVGNGSSYTLNKGDEFRFETSYGYATAPVKIAVRGNFLNDALDNQDALSLSFQRQDGSDYDQGYPYYFDIGQFGASKFRLDKYGNVGIGTSSPGAKLDVAGGVSAGSLSMGGDINLNDHSLVLGGGNSVRWNYESAEMYLNAGTSQGIIFRFDDPSRKLRFSHDGTNGKVASVVGGLYLDAQNNTIIADEIRPSDNSMRLGGAGTRWNSVITTSVDASGTITAGTVTATDMYCSGNKCAVVPTSQGQTELYSQESPEN